METNNNSSKILTIGGLANILKYEGVDIGRTRLFKWMRENGYLVKSGIDRNRPTTFSIDSGILEERKVQIPRKYGYLEEVNSPVVTMRGRKYFTDIFLYQGGNDNENNRKYNKKFSK